MKILLTFDVEIWCNGWSNLDSEFPKAFERYIFGHSRKGHFAMPKILQILDHNHLQGIFFVEPLFAARFGLPHLRKVVSLIQDAGHEVQLHLHPEWTDEITPPPLPNVTGKRQHLRYYSVEEQTRLIGFGIELLMEAGARRPIAFRAGGFAANADTFRALAANGIQFDSSIDATMPDSVPDLRNQCELYAPSIISEVASYPLSVFRDGAGKLRHAQIGACSTWELIRAMDCAEQAGWRQFLVLSHNFEMLKTNSNQPDPIVVRRFEQFCEYLGQSSARFVTVGFGAMPSSRLTEHLPLPEVGFAPTMRRYAEQALRRIY
jgi:peptidoglycan/xylan/chitin deacetylase (PgdA/CDA1 family)